MRKSWSKSSFQPAFKLSQNKETRDGLGAAHALKAQGHHAVADSMLERVAERPDDHEALTRGRDVVKQRDLPAGTRGHLLVPSSPTRQFVLPGRERHGGRTHRRRRYAVVPLSCL